MLKELENTGRWRGRGLRESGCLGPGFHTFGLCFDHGKGHSRGRGTFILKPKAPTPTVTCPCYPMSSLHTCYNRKWPLLVKKKRKQKIGQLKTLCLARTVAQLVRMLGHPHNAHGRESRLSYRWSDLHMRAVVQAHTHAHVHTHDVKQ